MNKKEHLKKVLEEIRIRQFPEIPEELVDKILRIQSSNYSAAEKRKAITQAIVEQNNK